MSKPRRVVVLVEQCSRSNEPYWYMEGYNITCIHVNVNIKKAPVCGDTTFVYVNGDHRYVKEGDMLVLEETDDTTDLSFVGNYRFWRLLNQDD